LVVLAEPIVRLIYQHGRFVPSDTEMTALALGWYAAGLAAYAGIRVISPAFLALDDARSPMLVGLGSILTNFVLNWLFVRHLRIGHWGLALSASLVSVSNFAVLLCLMRSRSRGIEGRRLVRSALKIVLASILMAAVVRGGSLFLEGWLGSLSVLARLITVAGSILLGLGSYLLLCKMLSIDELALFRGLVKNRLSRKTDTAR
jgi:putative peptidoglycan lipid II flippase